jgi:hypothetical protein
LPEEAPLSLGTLRVLDAGVGDVVRAEPFEAVDISVSELLGQDDP